MNTKPLQNNHNPEKMHPITILQLYNTSGAMIQMHNNNLTPNVLRYREGYIKICHRLYEGYSKSPRPRDTWTQTYIGPLILSAE